MLKLVMEGRLTHSLLVCLCWASALVQES